MLRSEGLYNVLRRRLAKPGDVLTSEAARPSVLKC
jgi:hypothetical protein